jgi:FRG domain
VIRKETLYSWEDFKQYASRYFLPALKNQEALLFRGQGNANWELTPTFDRAFSARKDGADLEKALLKEFAKQCGGYDEYRSVAHRAAIDDADKNVELVALGQHLGLPTKLLDWTESPYIAAFFAFQSHFYEVAKGQRIDQKVAIWVLKKGHKIWGENKGVEIVSAFSGDNSRLRNQVGWFTRSKTPFSCLEKFIDACEKESGSFGADGPLQKIELPGSIAVDAMLDLELMGIKASYLYPDSSAGLVAQTLIKTLLNNSR